MDKAIPDFKYDFDHVPIEVRAFGDPFAGKTEEEVKESEDPKRSKSSFSFWAFVMWIALITFIISLVLYVILTIIDCIKDSHDQGEARQLVKSRASE
jgi:hypothetical protein